MTDGEINRASVTQLVRAVSESQMYAFLIGAGSSRPDPAGIPTGGELIETWQRECYGDADTDEELDEWVTSREEQMGADEGEYGFWFEHRHPTRGERRERIQDLVETATPTLGHIILAKMMAEDYVPHVMTPNFDDLLFDAFYLFLEDKPHLVNHRAVAPEFKLTRKRPAIVKLHGDYLYDNLKNTDSETASLSSGMEEALQRTVTEYGLVVVGYSGGDESIMEPLNDTDLSEYGIYWCVRNPEKVKADAEDADPTDPASLLHQDNTYLVEIDGFVSLLSEFGQAIEDVELPSSDDLRERAENRAEMVEGVFDDKPDKDEAGDDTTPPDNNSIKTIEAQFAKSEGKYHEAIELLTEVLDDDPENAAAYNNRGDAKQGLEEYEAAIDDYDQAIDIDPENDIAYNNRGNAKQELGEYEAAIDDYDQAIDIDPENDVAYNNRGNAKQELGKYEAAIDDYDQAIDIDPENDVAYNNRGNAKQELGEYEAAIDDYDQAIDLDLEKARTYYNRGNAKQELGEYEAAIDDYDQAIDLDPEDTAAYYNRGNVKQELGEYEAAIDDYDQAIDLDPEDTAGYNNRGNVKQELGEYEAAIDDYDQAIDLDPENPSVYYNRGTAKLKLGEYEAAIDDYDQAIDLDPENPSVFQNRAEALIALGDAGQAQQDARKAYDYSSSPNETAESLLLELIASKLLDEDTSDLEDEYQAVCDEPFPTSWSFEPLDSWLETADLDEERQTQIEEWLDQLREHKDD